LVRSKGAPPKKKRRRLTINAESIQKTDRMVKSIFKKGGDGWQEKKPYKKLQENKKKGKGEL